MNRQQLIFYTGSYYYCHPTAESIDTYELGWRDYKSQRAILSTTKAVKKFSTAKEAKNFLAPIIAPDQPIIIDITERKKVWGFTGYTIECTDTHQIKITLYTVGDARPTLNTVWVTKRMELVFQDGKIQFDSSHYRTRYDEGAWKSIERNGSRIFATNTFDVCTNILKTQNNPYGYDNTPYDWYDFTETTIELVHSRTVDSRIEHEGLFSNKTRQLLENAGVPKFGFTQFERYEEIDRLSRLLEYFGNLDNPANAKKKPAKMPVWSKKTIELKSNGLYFTHTENNITYKFFCAENKGVQCWMSLPNNDGYVKNQSLKFASFTFSKQEKENLLQTLIQMPRIENFKEFLISEQDSLFKLAPFKVKRMAQIPIFTFLHFMLSKTKTFQVKRFVENLIKFDTKSVLTPGGFEIHKYLLQDVDLEKKSLKNQIGCNKMQLKWLKEMDKDMPLQIKIIGLFSIRGVMYSWNRRKPTAPRERLFSIEDAQDKQTFVSLFTKFGIALASEKDYRVFGFTSRYYPYIIGNSPNLGWGFDFTARELFKQPDLNSVSQVVAILNKYEPIFKDVRPYILRDYLSLRRRLAEQQIIQLKDWPIVPRNRDEATAYHDALNQYAAQLKEIENHERVQDYKDRTASFANQMYYEENGYVLSLCTNPYELLNEGRVLHHCVGSYVDQILSGNSYIIFLRKSQAPQVPFVTINVSASKKSIIQIHGVNNYWLGNWPDAVPVVMRWLKKNKIACGDEILLSTAKGYRDPAAPWIAKPHIA
ncbi:MAG: PcfJ domain-containing protein [Bacillus sp. (in: Bacteria)]|nr:PcfJ domain-containing protein [Parasporobacterium sp.]MBR3381019.1 PcfJ domain-containing protein [Bacillus sp. (in: firmicutes)]